MTNLQMFNNISEEDLSKISGGYNRLAGQLGHYAGKAAIVAGVAFGIFS
ncbi:bacteriocin [Ligilactobacillus murinus]|nr:bacteriocin [Ligilactobacillus murinus]